MTGVSGSGKSTIVNDTLRPAISRRLYRSFDQPLEYDSIEGLEHIDKLVVVDQSPIGRTPRSNPATYSNVSVIYANSSRPLPMRRHAVSRRDVSPSM